MRFFLDSVDVEAVKTCVQTGLMGGLTTNPVLMARAGNVSWKTLEQLAQIVPGDVNFQVLAQDRAGMVAQGKRFRELGQNVVVKVPLTPDGLGACQDLVRAGIRVNVTLCFSVPQAVLAARAGAHFVSPFMGRLESCGGSADNLISGIRQAYDLHSCETQIVAASIRSVTHLEQAACAGAEIATCPLPIFWEAFKHPLTDGALAGLSEAATQLGTLV